MSKTFKTIKPYVAPPPTPYAGPTDNKTFVPATSYKNIPANAAVIRNGIEWFKTSLSHTGVGLNPMNPNVTVESTLQWILFKLDGKLAFSLDRYSSDMQCYSRTDGERKSLGTFLFLIESWKKTSKTAPHGVTLPNFISPENKA